ncbi:hypothetical protein Q5425_21940 [Amycolatopsis sp. A133]|uniref:hypothetical protein n=1 Tax=Amycolatopsis sp. A133 TaxID=3064472 RepID=UPI0027F682BD|nr:hypothetical protein [Amycolatopsis sp. A133]MDQ7806411.1 hypothetical protein [Amycolatopsis sp. A133]
MTEDFGFPFGCVAAVAAVIVADLAGATGHPWYALVTLGTVVLVAAYRGSPAAAAGVGVVAWALHTGFVLGRFGELTFDEPARLAAFVLASALVTGAVARAAVSTLQARQPALRVREPAVRAREFAGRVLRVP